MPNKGSRKTTDFVRHFSILMHENKLFCQIQYCASPAQSMPKTGLRSKRRFLGFARKTQPSVTGKTPISGICPQMLDPVPPKADKKRTVLPNFVYSRTHGTPSGPNYAFHVPSHDAMQRHRINLLCIFNAKKRNLRFIRENSALIIQMFLILQRLRNKEHFETYSWLVIPRRPSCDL